MTIDIEMDSLQVAAQEIDKSGERENANPGDHKTTSTQLSWPRKLEFSEFDDMVPQRIEFRNCARSSINLANLHWRSHQREEVVELLCWLRQRCQ